MIEWKSLIREAFRGAGHDPDADIVEELSQHAATEYQTARANEWNHDEAMRHVSALVKVWCSEAPALRHRPRRAPMVEPPVMSSSRITGIANDFRYGIRTLGRQPMFAGLAILTVALAIGVMTTLFSVAYGVLLKPLPWPEPDRLLRLSESHPGASRQTPWMMSNIGYLPWRDQPETIEGLAAWSRTTVTITGAGDTDRILVASVSASTFPVLRAMPLIGAVFTSDEENQLVLSYGIWQQRFGGSPSVLGQMVSLDGKPYTVVGVMPGDFAFPDRETRVWKPFSVPPVIGRNGSTSVSVFNAIARLRPGVTPRQAAAEATARARNAPDPGMAAMAMFGTRSPAEISALPALEAMTQDVRPALLALVAAVALLLVTAVANVASLQLARATTRQREMAIRSAIGAGTTRLIQQLMAESMLLSVAGGIAGLLLSAALHRVLPSLLPVGFPRVDDVALSWQVSAFAFVLMFSTGLVLGVLPSVYLRGLRLVESLTENGAGSIGGKRTRARMTIMAGQVAIACTLLIGAALLGRSFMAMLHVDRGYDPRNVLTTRVTLPDFAFDTQRRVQFIETFLDRARLLPNSPRAAITSVMPLTGSENISGFTMPSRRPPLGTTAEVHSVRSVVSDDYFGALGMRLALGRNFTKADDVATAPKVVIVNRTFAREYLSDSPIGDTISNFMRGDGIEYEVIGIVDDVVRNSLSERQQPEIYSLIHQSLISIYGTQNIVLRTPGDPRELIEPLKSLVKEQAPYATLGSIATMEDRISTSLATPRLYAALLGTFALSALVIASVGLFGVLSYTVAQRTREIAVRSALGARPGQVIRLVLQQGLVVTIAGLFAGVAASMALVTYLTTLLYGVTAHDWLSFAAVSITIITIAVLACIVPALRAVKINPLQALRM